MELIKLLGVLIVIVGFALKLDSILIIFLALITTRDSLAALASAVFLRPSEPTS